VWNWPCGMSRAGRSPNFRHKSPNGKMLDLELRWKRFGGCGISQGQLSLTTESLQVTQSLSGCRPAFSCGRIQ
jgi:hypothetical protein